MAAPSLAPLVESRRVLVCVGCGGVGKTTVAAALALAAARRGRRVLCMTVDPAKRLANSLGLAQMTTEAQRVQPALFEKDGLEVSGELTVMMLDPKRTFDDLVQKYASTDEARRRIFGNPLYRHLTTGLAGVPEYMAVEKLLSAHGSDAYDFVVLDTPPTRNALDFLDAPDRLVEALDGKAIRWFVQAFRPQKGLNFNLVARSVARVLRGIGQVTGSGFLEQIARLIADLNELFGGFKERAERVSAALRGPDFGYVLVTSLEPLALEEIRFLGERLVEQGMRGDALVINRVHRAPNGTPMVDDAAEALARRGVSLGADGPARLLAALADEQREAGLDRSALAAVGAARWAARRGNGPAIVEVSAQPEDVHSLVALAAIGDVLVANESGPK